MLYVLVYTHERRPYSATLYLTSFTLDSLLALAINAQRRTNGWVPDLGRNLFSAALAARKGVKTIFTKEGSIVDLGLFSIKLTRSDNLEHLDLAISKESKRTESECRAISGKTFGEEIILTASVPQNPIALSSAVSMHIDQKALQDGSSVVGNNNDSPTYGIHNRTVSSSTSKRSEVSCCEKNNPPSSMMVDSTLIGVRVQVILKIKMNTMEYKT